jgi:dipeptidyl aminopeptidase/acylaminoacyl peptidase
MLALIYALFFSANVFSDVLTKASINDWLSLKHVAQVAAAPDGKQVAYVIRHVDKNKIENIFKLYIYNGKDTKLITTHSDISNLNWSPNGKAISFLAKGNS